jgi:hypothetical protein
MPAIPILLLSYWKQIVLAIAIVGAIGYRAVLIHQRNAARAQAESIAVQLADWKAAEAICEASVARQNAAVNAMKSAAETAAAAARTREAKVAVSSAAIAQKEEERAGAIESAPVEGGCEGAIRWGNAQVQELGKW